jgi:hypothetical protein
LRFVCDVDLDQAPHPLAGLLSLPVQLLCEPHRVEGVDQLEEGHGQLGLVGLQVADEMPGDGRQD